MIWLFGKTRRINKECLRTLTHDWDVFGHPNWICCRPGCMVRADDLEDPTAWIKDQWAP